MICPILPILDDNLNKPKEWKNTANQTDITAQLAPKRMCIVASIQQTEFGAPTTATQTYTPTYILYQPPKMGGRGSQYQLRIRRYKRIIMNENRKMMMTSSL